MNPEAIDWAALERLRSAFLAGSAGAEDYWRSESDLASYDATFAQRIGWKWDYALGELSRRGWSPPRCELVDWGCGSGIAGRAFLDRFGVGSVTALRVWDRSTAAMAFAAKRAGEKYPGLNARAGLDGLPAGFILLVSHVVNELNAEQTGALADLASRARCVLWVEPGTYEASLTLIAIRERLRERLNVIAPCVHQGRCGILSPGNERHWCHHFARPPGGIFMDGLWGRFARLTGIDLRDLPLSFLALDERPAPALPSGATRVIGHPRLYKAYALLLGCDSTGVRERKLTKRRLPDEFRALKKGGAVGLQGWECAGDEILAAKPLDH